MVNCIKEGVPVDGTFFFEICEYLNVTPAEFFEPLAKDENLEMIKMFNLLNDEEKMFVNRIIHTLIAQKE